MCSNRSRVLPRSEPGTARHTPIQRLRGLWPYLGPAFVASVAYIDPGNFATNIAGGSELGYRLTQGAHAAVRRENVVPLSQDSRRARTTDMTPIVDAGIEEYAERCTTPAPEALKELEAETRSAFEDHRMMVGTVEGRFLEMLVHAVQPERVLEIGTFTGYSSIAMAAALPPGGRIVTCEVDEEHAAVARRHIEASGNAGRIELRVGPALETIGQLEGPFGFVFVDADKAAYRDYFEAVLPKLSPHGLIAVDNTLWGGLVVDPDNQEAGTRIIRQFNEAVAADPRVVCVVLPVRDGVTLIRRA
jgi:caffeoyl-CoA O-methyltransferase